MIPVLILCVAVAVLAVTVLVQTRRMNQVTERVVELDKLVATLIIRVIALEKLVGEAGRRHP